MGTQLSKNTSPSSGPSLVAIKNGDNAMFKLGDSPVVTEKYPLEYFGSIDSDMGVSFQNLNASPKGNVRPSDTNRSSLGPITESDQTLQPLKVDNLRTLNSTNLMKVPNATQL